MRNRRDRWEGEARSTRASRGGSQGDRIGVVLDLGLDPPDGDEEDAVGDEVAHEQGNESKACFPLVEASHTKWISSAYLGKPASVCSPPLSVYIAIRLQERKDERIRESREEREAEDDGLGDEHDEGPSDDGEDLLDVPAVGLELVGRVDLLASLLSAPPGDAGHEDGSLGLGGEPVQELGGSAEDDCKKGSAVDYIDARRWQLTLKPEVPPPAEELALEATDNGPENRSTDGGENHEGDGISVNWRERD